MALDRQGRKITRLWEDYADHTRSACAGSSLLLDYQPLIDKTPAVRNFANSYSLRDAGLCGISEKTFIIFHQVEHVGKNAYKTALQVVQFFVHLPRKCK